MRSDFPVQRVWKMGRRQLVELLADLMIEDSGLELVMPRFERWISRWIVWFHTFYHSKDFLRRMAIEYIRGRC